MTLLRRPSPMADVVTLRDAMERLFDDRFFRPLWPWDGDREAIPALDLYMTADAVIAKVALPGVKPEDIDVEIAADVVTIRGSYKEETDPVDAGYVHRELTRGEFTRSFAVSTPVRLDEATATFEDGLLIITIPKTDEVKPRHVKVDIHK
jgi:HSP20 family protein